MSRRARIWLVATAVAVLLVVGFLWVSEHIDSYDRRYSDCMRERESGKYFPTDAYDQAMRECERLAGLPPSPTGNPGSWTWP